jgi:hypothetical protein
MENPKYLFDLFDHDDNFSFIMKRMLESSMEESFNSNDGMENRSY